MLKNMHTSTKTIMKDRKRNHQINMISKDLLAETNTKDTNRKIGENNFAGLLDTILMIKNIAFEIKQTFERVGLLRWTSSKLTAVKWVEEKNNMRNSEAIIKPQRKGIIDCEYICIFQISNYENTKVSPRSLAFIMIPFYFFFYISIFDKSIIMIVIL